MLNEKLNSDEYSSRIGIAALRKAIEPHLAARWLELATETSRELDKKITTVQKELSAPPPPPPSQTLEEFADRFAKCIHNLIKVRGTQGTPCPLPCAVPPRPALRHLAIFRLVLLRARARLPMRARDAPTHMLFPSCCALYPAPPVRAGLLSISGLTRACTRVRRCSARSSMARPLSRRSRRQHLAHSARWRCQPKTTKVHGARLPSRRVDGATGEYLGAITCRNSSRHAVRAGTHSWCVATACECSTALTPSSLPPRHQQSRHSSLRRA